MEKAEEVDARMTTATPERYTGQSGDWGFIDFRQGVANIWAGCSEDLAVAMQEWALRHPDRFASVKAMAVTEYNDILILYSLPSEARLVDTDKMDSTTATFCPVEDWG